MIFISLKKHLTTNEIDVELLYQLLEIIAGTHLLQTFICVLCIVKCVCKIIGNHANSGTQSNTTQYTYTSHKGIKSIIILYSLYVHGLCRFV